MKPLILVNFFKKPTGSIVKIFALYWLLTAIIQPKSPVKILNAHNRISAKIIKHHPISSKIAPRSASKKNTPSPSFTKTIPGSQQSHSRYACLGSKVNWRSGPGSDHDMLWLYESPDWPVIVLKKYSNWYYIKDFTGELGWVKGAMLRFKTTLLITKDTPLYSKDRKSSPPKALLKKGAIVRYIRHTDGKWLYVVEPEHRLYGWILSDTSWPNPASL